MPRSLLWSDPRVKPPFGAAEVDWGHPLARGLIAVYLFNEGTLTPTNLVQNGVGAGATSAGSPSVISSVGGLGISTSNTTGNGFSLPDDPRWSQPPLSLVSQVVTNTTAPT